MERAESTHVGKQAMRTEDYIIAVHYTCDHCAAFVKKETNKLSDDPLDPCFYFIPANWSVVDSAPMSRQFHFCSVRHLREYFQDHPDFAAQIFVEAPEPPSEP
jgi:hypothetical protein